ncbi:MAG: MBL fold metallo-hydrolase [Lachnospiraceae bacterium]|nr:MBL fold metallo-hydrolase [Lachnospiraceae bacterium]
MNFMSIASGSSGNCLFVGSKSANILIDAGISCKKICEGLSIADTSPEDIDAILITHEHVDHIKGIEVFQKKYHTKIYATKGTYLQLKKKKMKLDDELFNEIEAGVDFRIGGFLIHPFSTLHDVADPVCYTVTDGTGKLSMLTDTGNYTEEMKKSMMNSNILYIESNHDENMLMAGSYSYQVKMRVISDSGHLSNERAAELINGLLWKGLKCIFLGHLSEENNMPALADITTRSMLDEEWKYQTDEPELIVAGHYAPSKIIEL